MPTAPRSRTTGPILSVGRRVFVQCPSSPSKTVELTDDAGSGSGTVLADGVEVEIVAWRPRGAAGTRYRVRQADRGVEGWLCGDQLRAPVTVAPKAPVAALPTTKTAAAKTAQRPVAAQRSVSR